MIKYWRIWWWWEESLNGLISMNRRRTAPVGQWLNIGECGDDERNSSTISYRWREKGHPKFGYDHGLANVFIVREIFRWSNLDVKKKHIECLSMIEHWRMLWWWEKFFNDLIWIKGKETSVVGQWANISECVHCERNSTMICSRWREKGYRMLVNDKTLPNVMMLREIVQLSHLDEEKKGIRCSSMIKHWRMWWWSEKLFNDLISMKRKRTSDVGQWSNIDECVHRQRNSSMI